jgi:hypothetical protein
VVVKVSLLRAVTAEFSLAQVMMLASNNNPVAASDMTINNAQPLSRARGLMGIVFIACFAMQSW